MSYPVILIVGRLSGPKNKIILKILKEVAPTIVQEYPSVKFQVVGGPVETEHQQLQRQHSWLRFEGYQNPLKPYYQRATLVVGAGRVALEAMALKKPVLAIGEKHYIGPLLPENVERAKETNFGDCAPSDDFSWPKMTRDLLDLLKNPKKRDRAAKTGFALVQSEFNMDKLNPLVEGLYQKVLLEKNLSLLHELPVLMYHRVVAKPPEGSKFNLYVTREKLEKQLDYLHRRGFETITFNDLLERRLPSKPIILSFDDGYEDNYHHLFPLLQKTGMKAVIFILGNRKHQTNFWDTAKGEPSAPLLKDSQILKMDRSGLVEFGAHSLNHLRLTDLSIPQARHEIEGSRKSLGRLLGKPVRSFAYPYGVYNEEIKKITAEAGYTFGISVGGRFSRFGDDLFEIRRVHMFPHTSPFDFWKKTSGYYLRYRIFFKSLKA